MRKGSKTIKIPLPKEPTCPDIKQSASDKTDYEVYDDMPVLDILIRICDACHEMQNETEPWASIRSDIEKLR